MLDSSSAVNLSRRVESQDRAKRTDNDEFEKTGKAVSYEILTRM